MRAERTDVRIKPAGFCFCTIPKKLLDFLLLKGSSVKFVDAFRMALTEEPK